MQPSRGRNPEKLRYVGPPCTRVYGPPQHPVPNYSTTPCFNSRVPTPVVYGPYPTPLQPSTFKPMVPPPPFRSPSNTVNSRTSYSPRTGSIQEPISIHRYSPQPVRYVQQSSMPQIGGQTVVQSCVKRVAEKYYPQLARCIEKCTAVAPALVLVNQTPQRSLTPLHQGGGDARFIDRCTSMTPVIVSTPQRSLTPVVAVGTDPVMQNCVRVVAEKYHPQLARCIDQCTAVVPINQTPQRSLSPMAPIVEPIVTDSAMQKCVKVVAEKYHPQLARCIEKCTAVVPVSVSMNTTPQRSVTPVVPTTPIVDPVMQNCVKTVAEKYHPQLARCIEKCTEVVPVSVSINTTPPRSLTPVVPNTLFVDPVTQNCLKVVAEKYHPQLAKCIDKCTSMTPVFATPERSLTPMVPVNTDPISQNCLKMIAEKYYPQLARCIEKCTDTVPVTIDASTQYCPQLAKCIDRCTSMTPERSLTPVDPMSQNCLRMIAEKYYPQLARCIDKCTALQPSITPMISVGTDPIVQNSLKTVAEKYHPQLARCIDRCTSMTPAIVSVNATPQRCSTPETNPVMQNCLKMIAEKYYPQLARCIDKCSTVNPTPIRSPIPVGTDPVIRDCVKKVAEKYHPQLAKCIDRCSTANQTPRRIATPMNSVRVVAEQGTITREKYHPQLAKCIDECSAADDRRGFNLNKNFAQYVASVALDERSRHCVLQLARKYFPRLAECLARCSDPCPKVVYDSSYDDLCLQDCVFLMAEKYFPELASGILTCALAAQRPTFQVDQKIHIRPSIPLIQS